MSPVTSFVPNFVGGKPNAPPDLRTILHRAYEKSAQHWHARFGFAYVSESGLDVLLGTLNGIRDWDSTQKRWILGLHHGITEPAAIARIRCLSNSKSRVFVGGNQLTADSLLVGPHFHAKVLCIERGCSRRATCLVASSANLTGAALGANARNYEAGIALLHDSIAKSSIAEFDRWWQSAWQASISVSDSVLDRYTKLRDAFLQRNPDTLSDLDPPSLKQLKAATVLHIEAGAMSGGSRNQVEFNRELAGFFGPVRRSRKNLRIAVRGHMWDDRPLTPKTTTFGVDIWRLGLPTEATGGFEYPGKVLQFKRRKDKQGTFFELDVADLDSRKHARWRGIAHRRGYIGLSSGKRAFGLH